MTRNTIAFDQEQREARPSTEYAVWRRNHFGGGWMLTARSVTARTDKEAQAKVKRMFAGAGFSSMSLLALPRGMKPEWNLAARDEGLLKAAEQRALERRWTGNPVTGMGELL